ncbi:MAG: PKD domain-containing protein, partial [Ginsengibacter sp.]
MKIYVLLPIIFGISLNLCAENSKRVTEANQIPIANAGPTVTIYLTETSTATLDGSASSGDSFQWKEISTDYMSGATITSPNSKVTTVMGLPQGVFYFQISAATAGTTVYDRVKVIVNYKPLPSNVIYTAGIPFNDPAFKTMVNLRGDTTNYLTFNQSYRDYWTYHFPNPITGADDHLYLERDRSNGMMLDSLNGKLYTTIENGYGGATAPNGTRYARSQVNLSGFTIDTNTTYIIIWKIYFPQSISAAWDPAAPNWARVTMWDVHGNDDFSGQFGMVLARDSLCFSDGIFQPNGSLVYLQSKLLHPTVDMYNKTNTIRITYREGASYPGQKAFIKIEVNGVQKYFRNSGQVGKTPQFDYMKVTGLYDYSNRLVNPNNTNYKRVSLVTEDASVYAIPAKPTVDAGSDKTISSTSISLSGTAHDLGVSGQGVITSYQWTKVSGGTATITSPNSANTTITGLSAGTYQFQLKATDNRGIVGYDTVQVVNNLPTNIPPTANAGSDKSITLPTNSVALSGSGVDTDGSVTSYQWTKISGPASGAINN